MNMKLNRIVCATAVVLAVFVAGCASVPKPSSALQEAQAAYEKAKGNTDVLKYASGNLNEANATLNSAAAATNLDDMNSLAYVANSQVQVAEAVAKRKSAEAQIAQLNTVKDSVQLEMRMRNWRLRRHNWLRSKQSRLTAARWLRWAVCCSQPGRPI